MKIIGANVTGSFILNGQDVTTTIQTSNAWSGSAASSISSLNTASGSAITRLSALEVTSGSNITRLSALETTSGSNITRLASLEAKTGSYATTGSNTFVGNQIISGSINTSGSITSTGTLTAQTLVVQTITSSVDYVTGSTRFGSLLANTHVFTGSMSVTGSVTATSFAGSGANLTSIPNSALNNSTISGISLGSNLATLTIGTGLSGTSYNGSTGVTIANTGILSISGGTGITVSGPNSNLTITNTITNTNQLTNGAGFITSAALSPYLLLSGGTTTGLVTMDGLNFPGNTDTLYLTNKRGGYHSLKILNTQGDYKGVLIEHQNGSGSGGPGPNGSFGFKFDDQRNNNYSGDHGASFIVQRSGAFAITNIFEVITSTGAKGIAVATGGNLSSSGDITAYSSDGRLKNNIKEISNALEKVKQIKGVTFDWNDTAIKAGFFPKIRYNDAGVIAQDIQKVLPQAVDFAPFDRNSNGDSVSGNDYLTVKYEKIVPLLIEAIKEQQTQIEELKTIINALTK